MMAERSNLPELMTVEVQPDQLVTFRASILSRELGQRLNRDKKTIGSTAKADLSRYYVLLKIGRDSIAGRLSSKDMNLIAGGVYEERRTDLLDLGWWDYDAARMQKALLIAKIQDAVRKYPLERIHETNASELISKIDAMNELEVAALVDTVERYWSLRPKAAPGTKAYAEVYEALDFITNDRVSMTFLPAIKMDQRRVASQMPTNRQKTLADTVREYTQDPFFQTWDDHDRDVLHIEATLGGSTRHLTFGEVPTQSLQGLDDEQRAAAVSTLFGNAADWPPGVADVRFVRDGVVISTTLSQTDIYVFVNDVPVSQGVRISTPMTART
jgi:hypothetical protein